MKEWLPKFFYLLISRFVRLYQLGYVNFLHSKYHIEKNITFSSYTKIINLSKCLEKLKIGSNSKIDGQIIVFPSSNGIIIGDNCYLGVNSRIWSSDKIIIGSDVLISHDVNIMDTDSHEIDYLERAQSARLQLRQGLPEVNHRVRTAPIIIKDNVWISYNVSILKGVTIGEGSIIGCGSVVTHDIPRFCLAVGNPAKIIKQLDNIK